jgi:hypothetical protein
LSNTSTDHLGEIGVKLAALDDLMEMSRWSDRRDVRLLASIRRDLKRAMRQDEAFRACLQEARAQAKDPALFQPLRLRLSQGRSLRPGAQANPHHRAGEGWRACETGKPARCSRA